MANGIDWFRWHHGTVTDQKWPLIAKRTGASVAEVIAAWACLLEEASAAGERGLLSSEPDFEAIDCHLGMADGRAEAIYRAMIARDLVDGHGHIVAWHKRQPKREREDDTAADRKRRQRERESGGTSDVPPGHATVTPCHATSHQKTPRGEESREEKEKGAQQSATDSRARSCEAEAAGPTPPAPPPPLPPAPPAAPAPAAGNRYGLAALAMRQKGMGDAHPGDPRLRALVDADVSIDELEAVAVEAVGKSRGFAWALTALTNRRAELAAKPIAPKPEVDWRSSRSTVSAHGVSLGLPSWADYERDHIRRGVAPRFDAYERDVEAADARQKGRAVA